METTIENHNQPKCRVVETGPRACMYKALLHPKFREHYGRGGLKIPSARGSGKLFLRVALEAMSAFSHPQELPNVSWMRTSMDMPRWTGQSPSGLSLTQRPIAIKESWEQDRWSPGKSTPMGSSVSDGQPKNIHPSNVVIRLKQIMFRNMYCIHTYIYTCNSNQCQKRSWIWSKVGRGP